MATLDATQIPATSLGINPHQSTTSQSGADWDIDDADEIPGGQAFPESEVETTGEPSASEEWNLDDGWETNIPIAVAVPVVAANPVKPSPELMSALDCIGNLNNSTTEETADVETASLVATDDPEAIIEVVAEVAASEEVPQIVGEVSGETKTIVSGEIVSSEPIEETTDDILALIVEAERKCERTGATVIGLTARLKEAKENDKAAQNELRELIREVGMDFSRPMVAKPATAKTESTKASEPTREEASDPDEDEEDENEIDFDNDDNTDLEDESKRSASQPTTERGNPTRIRITQEDEQFPQLLLDSEHAVTAFEEEGEPGEGIVTIDDPANSEKELFLSPAEYEVVAWEELPVEEVASIPISTGPNSAAASQAKANEKNSRPEDDSWRKASLLDDVGLPPNLAALLEGNPEKTLKTMGDVQDWTAKGNNLNDIPKVGPAKVTQLEDAFEKFWARWNAKK